MSFLTHWLEHIGVLAVFALVLVEQIGLPLPTFPFLVIAGAWSAHGGAPLWKIGLAAVAACLLADLSWYAAGSRLGSRILRSLCRLSLEPDSCVADTEHMFARFGTRILLVAKFVPGLGAVATAMSGVVRASLVGFVTYDILGAILWAGTGVALGAVFHDAVDDVFRELSALGRTGALFVLALLVAFLALKAWRRHLFFRQLRMDRITVQELFNLQEAGTPVLVVDARPSATRKRDGVIPGAVAIEAVLQGTDERLKGGEAVVYCACPNEATAARVARRLVNLGFHPVRPLTGGIHAWQDAGFQVVLP
jgi:membrane protein DedA with SNARE-associated domain/rhodanese-related sulfurtransferase